MVDLGHVEVLKLPPGAIVPSAAIVPAEMPPRRYLQYLSRLSSIWKACLGDPVISACLGKDLVKWVVVEDILQDWIYVSQNENSLHENDK
jgi:hypothetical protein